MLLFFCWGLPYSLPKGDTFVNSDALTIVEFPWSHGLSSRTAYTAVTVDMLQSPSRSELKSEGNKRNK